MAQITKNYDVTIETHHLTDRSTDKLGKLAYVTLSEEFIIHSNDYLVPFHALDNAVVVTSMDTPPKIFGVDNTSVWENSTFDPMDGVYAEDKDGNPVPVTYTGTVDTSTPGTYWLTYSATDSEGRTGTARRRVFVREIPAPRFTGITPITVNTTTPIDLEAGVHAWIESTEISYTYAPTSVDNCTDGVTTVTYTAIANGKITTVDRRVTVRQFDPIIHGNTPMTAFVYTEVDVLDGLTGEEGSGDTLAVVLDETLYTLTQTVDGVETESDFLEDAVVRLDPPTPPTGYLFKGWYDNPTYTGSPISSVTMESDKAVYAKLAPARTLTMVVQGESTTQDYELNEVVTLPTPTVTGDRKKFSAWYDNAEYTGTAITTVTMTSDKTVYAKVADQVAYAKVDGGILQFFTDDEGKYDSDASVYKAWETANLTTPRWSGATIIGVEVLDEIRPTSMTNWFNGSLYSGLRTIETWVGLDKINTSNCTNFNRVFKGQQTGLHLDLSSWDTKNVTAMIEMFAESNFTSLDLSGWNVDSVGARSAGVFKNATLLTTIYAEWNLVRLSQSDFFQGCTSLVGGQGTAYATAGVASNAYARPDGGTSAPGYFTLP